jgi:hypothetical protein
MEFESPFFPMPITRSRGVLEVESEAIEMKRTIFHPRSGSWSYRAANVDLDSTPPCGNDGIEGRCFKTERNSFSDIFKGDNE